MSTTLYPQATAALDGGTGNRFLTRQRYGGATTDTTVTTATVSGTSIQCTATAGGSAVAYYWPVGAGTISGNVSGALVGKESVATVNAGAGIAIELWDSTNTTKKATLLAAVSFDTEYGTTIGVKSLGSTALSSAAAANGDLIKVIFLVRNVGTMAAGTVTNYYNENGTGTDTQVTFATTLPAYVNSSASEAFATLPSDLYTFGGASPINTAVSDYGNPIPSLMSTGNGDGFNFTSRRFFVDGDFDFTYDINICPDGTASRDIADFAFWLSCQGTGNETNVNGFAFRLQNSGGDGGFKQIVGSVFQGGSQSITGIGTNFADVNPATWYRVHLVAVSGVATATVTDIAAATVFGTYTLDLNPFFNADVLMSCGVFGQIGDGAGTTIGHRYDNFTLVGASTGTTVVPTILIVGAALTRSANW